MEKVLSKTNQRRRAQEISGKQLLRWARCPGCKGLHQVSLEREPLNLYLTDLGFKLGDPTRVWHGYCLNLAL